MIDLITAINTAPDDVWWPLVGVAVITLAALLTLLTEPGR